MRPHFRHKILAQHCPDFESDPQSLHADTVFHWTGNGFDIRSDTNGSTMVSMSRIWHQIRHNKWLKNGSNESDLPSDPTHTAQAMVPISNESDLPSDPTHTAQAMAPMSRICHQIRHNQTRWLEHALVCMAFFGSKVRSLWTLDPLNQNLKITFLGHIQPSTPENSPLNRNAAPNFFWKLTNVFGKRAFIGDFWT